LLAIADVIKGTFASRMVCFFLMYANHSINFFLYCLTGGKFRAEFQSLLCRTLRAGQRPRRDCRELGQVESTPNKAGSIRTDRI